MLRPDPGRFATHRILPETPSIATRLKNMFLLSTSSPKSVFPQFVIEASVILIGSFLLSGRIPTIS